MSGKTVHLIAIDKKRELESTLRFPPHFNTLTAVFFKCPDSPRTVIHTITLSHGFVFRFPTGTRLCPLFCPLEGLGAWWEVGGVA